MLSRHDPHSHSFFAWLRALLVLILLALLYPLLKTVFFLYSPANPSEPQAKVILILKGQTPHDISVALGKLNLTQDPEQFLWAGRLTRLWKTIKAGEYELKGTLTPLEIFQVFGTGISLAHPVTLREGENLFELADDLVSKGLVVKSEFLKLCKDPHFLGTLELFPTHLQPSSSAAALPPSLEGYLFPNTYFLNRSQSAAEIIKAMVKQFKQQWQPLAQEQITAPLRLNRHEIITLASMIEKETGVPEERPLISSVFYNRLLRKMKLQSDPTTIYGMWEGYHGKIHHQDLLLENPYNTYTLPGLPIGPIGNPGKQSILAALKPAVSPYLFFVSHNDGTHQFSVSFTDHLAAVKTFQLTPKNRLGKSWRDRLPHPHRVNH